MRLSCLLSLSLLACAKAPPPPVQGQAHVELLRSGPVRTVEGPTPDTATRLSVCPALQGLQIQALSVDDEDGDGHWRPGERLRLALTVVNRGEGPVLGPAITVDGLPAGFSVALPRAELAELEPGAPAALHSHVLASPELVGPVSVELQVRPTDGRSAACPGVDGLLLRVELE